MRKGLIALGMAALVSCGGTTTEKIVYMPATDAPTKKSTTTDAPIATPAPTQPPVVWSAEDEFLFDIKNSVGYVGVSDYDLLDTGYTVCAALRNGATVYDLADAITSIGAQQEFLAAVSASAALNLCPDQAWKFSN